MGRIQHPVLHLELHTPDEGRARAFYSQLLRWHPEQIGHGAYQALDLGNLGGGIVECGTRRSLWLPYAEVDAIEEVTERARSLGASVILEPREGPTGWRSVISTPTGGEIGLWQAKNEVETRHG